MVRVLVISIGIVWGINFVGEVENGDIGEFVLEVGGEISSRYDISVSKYAKVGSNAKMYDSVVWVVNWSVGAGFCRGFDGEVNMSKIYYVSRLMALYIEVL